MAITDYHRAIFNYLEAYRSEHPEAGLTYSLRQKNTTGRPRNLYLFTGSDKYISIGLYSPISNNNKTRTISFYADYDPVTNSLKNCTLAIVFSDQHLLTQETLYQQIIQQIGSEKFKEYRDKRFELCYPDADWQKNLQTYLEQHKPIIDKVLQEAGVDQTFQIPLKQLEADITVANQPTPTPLEPAAKPTEKYTWIPFYRELCSKLLHYSTDKLIRITKQVLRSEKLVGLVDQDAEGNKMDLTVIDPYTVLSFIRICGDDKRPALFLRLKHQLDLSSSIPTDWSGLYTDKNQWVWSFGYSYERAPDDIDKLWELYKEAEQYDISEDLFNQVLTIKKLSKSKLTESLFAQNPDLYFPVNSKTKEWLKKRKLTDKFTSFTEYLGLMEAVSQHDPRPFYELSEEAYSEAVGTINPTNYWVFQGNPNQFRIIDSLRDNALQTWRVAAHANKIKPGDKVILWVTGSQSGCYALAQVDSEVYAGTDEAGEHYYQLTSMGKEATQRVKITLLHNLWDQPVLKTQLQDLTAFADFNGGNQGTNFTATPEQYELIKHMAQPTAPRFWKYASGRDANRWPEDIQDGVMAIDYSNNNTGSLTQYDTKTDLDNHLGKVNGNSKDTSSMMLFKDAYIGDVVIANLGLTKVIGIGIISGPYQYRDDGPYNQHYRTVNWLADQPWQYTEDQFTGHKVLFGRTAFTRTTIGSLILQEYVKQYPQYRSVFEQHGLLDHTSSLSNTKPMPTVETNHSKNIILYGPPGTGKTFGTIDLAIDIIDGQSNPDHKVNKVRFDQLREEGQVEFVTFHQSYTYEDFVVGIKPDVNAGSLKFDYNYGILYRIAEKARTNFLQNEPASPLAQKRPFEEVFNQFTEPLIEEGKEIPVKMAKSKWFNLTDVSERTIEFRKSNGNTDDVLSIAVLKRMYEGSQRLKHEGLNVYYNPLAEVLQSLGQTEVSVLTEIKLENYVLIIDEINRANMSRVFGELITLLEDDKRLGADNELTVTLPSGEPFILPPNLYLIGTMNTADKSLALLDIALRRRFEFIYTKPDPDLLDSPAREILTKLNQAIRAEHKPADFLIGHAYFMGKDESQLPDVFNNRVTPLLMEYFNGKVQTVIKVLDKAGVKALADPITDELKVSHVE